MKTFILSLPTADNDGQPTNTARAALIDSALERGDSVRAEPAEGLWYSDTGELYREPTTYVEIATADAAALARDVKQFGATARQLAMLFVEKSTDGAHLLAVSPADSAPDLARDFGGATIRGGVAESLRYSGFEQGADY